ncbi:MULTISPECIES: HAD family phosphatase [unclassified Cyanobium]|uniref:HAD family hydrolase n=1 Tax=unclassified Cyanobium TaxID=2627006 RepID=UPI001644A1A5|nr:MULTISPECIES: HAD family phosphatase [unclassified Cyanobium]MBE9154917.1 HAD family phosphatase [Cyanobium sp. LEGE 06113]QNI70651.1 HAD hydrolase/ IA/ variant 3 family protein [Cyanobium sp. NS01]
MNRPAACLFDLDGLLLDTEPLHARAWQEAASRFGRPLSPEELSSLRGRRRLDCAEQVCAWISASPNASPAAKPAVAELLAVRQPIAEALLVQAPPIQGAPQLLQRCRERAIPMALVTSSAEASVALKCAPHDWLGGMKTCVYGDDPELSAGKPAPDPFLMAAQRLGVPSCDCWAFEDSLAGSQAALGAGCQVYVLLPDGALREHYPAAVQCLRSLEDVLLE